MALYLQIVLGMGALETGIGLLPLSLALLVTSVFATKLGDWFYPRIIIQVGLAAMAAGCVFMIFGVGVGLTRARLIPGLLILGAGIGLLVSQLMNVVLSSVPQEEVNEASGLNSMMMQLGIAVGTAVLGTILIAALSSGLGTRVGNSSVIPDELKVKIEAAVKTDVKMLSETQLDTVSELKPVFEEKQVDIEKELVRINSEAQTDAVRKALAAGAILALLGFFISPLLPKQKLV